jgi:hypothetical protein
MCEMSSVSSETVKPLLAFEKKFKDDADEAIPLEGSGVLGTLKVSCRKRSIGTKEGREDGTYCTKNEAYLPETDPPMWVSG